MFLSWLRLGLAPGRIHPIRFTERRSRIFAARIAIRFYVRSSESYIWCIFMGTTWWYICKFFFTRTVLKGITSAAS